MIIDRVVEADQPRSTGCMTAAAVYVLESEPIGATVSAAIGRRAARSA